MRSLLCGLIIVSLSHPVLAKELIAYSHLTNDTWQIWVMDPDGKNQRQVTYSPQDKRDPAWINGSQALAFRTGNSTLYTVGLDGKNEQQVLSKYGVVTNPNFSKVDNRIVFIRFDPRGRDKADIWTSDINGEDAKLLTRDKIGKFQPRFSNRGDRIAFVQVDRKRPDYHLWVMNADGSDQRQLTEGAGFDTHPDFSPDDQAITFSSNRNGGNFEIYNLYLKDMRQVRLTRFPGLDTQSRFSPDGKKIVFTSNRSGNQQIWAMNADGSGPVQLTNDPSESMDPEWGIVPSTQEQ